MSNSIRYAGVDDLTLDLFESQYVVPNGMSYNSYVIVDDRVAIMDTVDERRIDAWWQQLESLLAGRTPDYLVIHHLEPDHTGGIVRLVEKYPNVQVVLSVRASQMLPAWMDNPPTNLRTVKEGDCLSLGKHTLQFFMAPMVHWPEVMMSYESTEKVFFSADAFGKFGALSVEEDWACEARRYYFNICGKYGASVKSVLERVAPLDIQTICPLHGPVLTENIAYYWHLYTIWSQYEVEAEGVFVTYASIHGGTAQVAEALADLLRLQGAAKVSLMDLCRCDMAEAVEDAFKYGKMVLAACSYDGGLFTPMHNFLHLLQSKAYQKRRIGLIENGSWAPSAARAMKAMLEPMKELSVVEPVVSIRSRMRSTDQAALEALAAAMLA